MPINHVILNIAEMIIPTMIAFPVTCSYFLHRKKAAQLPYKYTLPGFFLALVLAALPAIIDGSRGLDMDTVSGFILFVTCPLVGSWLSVKLLYYCKHELSP